MILAVAPSPSLDATLEVPELVLGEIARPTAVTRVAGGKALNAARVAHALGASVEIVTALGGPSGGWVAELLAADGVACSAIGLAAQTRMCSAIVVDGGATSSTDLYEPSAPFAPDEWDAFAALARARVATLKPSWVALSGSLPVGVPLEGVVALLAEARAAGARVAVDASGDALRATIASADLVKVNRAEAATVLSVAPRCVADACRRLHVGFGVDAVVTDGVHGAAALVDGAIAEVPPPARLGRFPAGSGDAFLGGLLATLDAGGAIADALVAAADAAERNALVAGQGVLAPR